MMQPDILLDLHKQEQRRLEKEAERYHLARQEPRFHSRIQVHLMISHILHVGLLSLKKLSERAG